MLNILTVDVEEYFQVHNFAGVVHRDKWDSYESRVEAEVDKVLNLLSEAETRATFFVLGWVAERHANMVRRIQRAGHEIATHGYEHQLIYRQTPEEFAADLRRSIEIIGNITGEQVLGYRAPSFSITQANLWALEIIREQGLKYDSSIFPLVIHDRYGIAVAARHPHLLENGLWEFPIATIPILGKNIPVGGGGYLRVLPYSMVRWALKRINAEGQPFVIYFHSWELDPDQPRIRHVPLFYRFRHYVNLNKMENCVRALLRDFQFGPVREVFANQLGGR